MPKTTPALKQGNAFEAGLTASNNEMEYPVYIM